MKFTYWIVNKPYRFCTFDVEQPYYKQSATFTTDNMIDGWHVTEEQLKNPDTIHDMFCNQISKHYNIE